jgi:hypothetical protein
VSKSGRHMGFICPLFLASDLDDDSNWRHCHFWRIPETPPVQNRVGLGHPMDHPSTPKQATTVAASSLRSFWTLT